MTPCVSRQRKDRRNMFEDVCEAAARPPEAPSLRPALAGAPLSPPEETREVPGDGREEPWLAANPEGPAVDTLAIFRREEEDAAVPSAPPGPTAGCPHPFEGAAGGAEDKLPATGPVILGVLRRGVKNLVSHPLYARWEMLKSSLRVVAPTSLALCTKDAGMSATVETTFCTRPSESVAVAVLFMAVSAAQRGMAAMGSLNSLSRSCAWSSGRLGPGVSNPQG